MRTTYGTLRRILQEAATSMQYTGVFLDEASHTELLEWWVRTTGRPLLAKTFAHHMTIKFQPSKEELKATPMGQQVTLKVVGWAADPRGQAVLVRSEGVRSSNLNPHVTVACAAGVGPVYSNELLATGVNAVDGPVLTGTVAGK